MNPAPHTRTVMMFAGQGAQYYQMGRELYDHDPAYRAAMDECDAAAGMIEGRPVSQIILGRPMADSESFDRQLDSTPALLAVGYSLARSLFARGLRPDLLLGYSFGETIAALVAGVYTLEDAFALVLAQARLIEATLAPGAMVAILAPWDAVRHMPGVAGACELAAINSPRHCVVSLPPAALPALLAALDARDIIAARLPVRYGFHASFIDAAGPGLRALSASMPRRLAAFPTISCMTAGPVVLDDDHFWHVARRPIRFADTIQALVAAGPCRFIEAGPTGTLATFAKQVLGPRTPAFPAINQFGQNRRTMAEIEALLA